MASLRATRARYGGGGKRFYTIREIRDAAEPAVVTIESFDEAVEMPKTGDSKPVIWFTNGRGVVMAGCRFDDLEQGGCPDDPDRIAGVELEIVVGEAWPTGPEALRFKVLHVPSQPATPTRVQRKAAHTDEDDSIPF